MNQRDLRTNSYNFLCPDFKEEDIIKIINYEILDFVSKYMKAIENNIFNKYSFIDEKNNEEYFKSIKNSNEHEEKQNDNNINNNNNNNGTKEEITNNNNNIKPFRLLNIINFNTLIFDYPIFKNFSCEEITKYLSLFIPEFQEKDFPEIKKAFDEKLSKEEITEIFSHINAIDNIEDLNFSYSSLVILLIQFCLKLKSSEGKTFQESIDFLFANEFNLTPDVKNVMEQIQEKEEEEEDFDFVPESETLNEAKNAKLGDEESELIIEVLENLEKTLPPININVINFANDKPMHSNNLFLNKYEVIPAKFPLELLKVEIDEQKNLKKEMQEIHHLKKFILMKYLI